MIKVDPHVHTKHSGHATITVPKLESQAKNRRIDCIGITDHDTMGGAFELQECSNQRIILGEEVTTNKGEIIGLFLTKPLTRGKMNPRSALKAIKDQGGLTMIPHPFDHLRKRSLHVLDIILESDIIEVFNSRTLYKEDNEKAEDLAKDHGLVRAVGSDAHMPMEIGNAYMVMGDFKGPDAFLKRLRSPSTKFYTHTSSIIVHVYTKVLKKLYGYGKGGGR